MKTITIIDTFGFLFRSYFALPPLRSKKGFPTGLLTGFMNFVANIGKDFETDYIVFALDSKGDTFRKEIYDAYKAHRPDVPEDLLRQLPVAIELIEKMGFKTAMKDGFEADDIVASIATDAKRFGLKARIVSHDKDLYQLIDDDTIFLFDPIKKDIVNEEKCIQKYGIKPSQFIDYQALIGDSADNVPGVKGVGAKTAEALISEFGTLENIYANLENIEKKRWKTLLEESRELAFISKELVTLKTDSHSIDILEDFVLPRENPILKIADILVEYDLTKVLERVHKDGLSFKTEIPTSTKSVNFEPILLDTASKLFSVVKSIPDNSIVAFDTETNSLDVEIAKIVGFSFCYDDKKSYYVPISHNYLGVGEQIDLNSAKEAIVILNKHKLVAQNFKYDYEIVKNNFQVELNIYADTMILAWLLRSDEKVGLDYLAKKYFNHIMISFSDTVKKGEDFSNVDISNALLYASEDAYITYLLYFKLLKEFKEGECLEVLQVAKDVEFDFINVLSSMERNGIKLNVLFLKNLKDENSKYILDLTNKIYEKSGTEFNINSPKQLGTILFDVLKLPTQKKTKSGYSTNEAVLHKLYTEHEIIPLLLDYREAFKLQSTYIEPLLQIGQKEPDNRVHTSFIQTGTATGRLSSKNPNLQNIPVRSEAGQKIREAFIADIGNVLIGIDYSQIELRLLAHFSEDEALMNAFNENLDIHMQTAIKIFGEEEAKAKRNIAKSINFGLLYGMGSKKLGETLGIASKEAKGYIDSYFKSFPTVKNYLASVGEFASDKGYVKTLLNRRRYFDFANATPMLKAAYLRESTNTLFQGSASDLIKLAMIEIYKKYKNNDNVKLLLQIHDELILEVKEEDSEKVSNEIKDIMKNIYKLKVPLDVSVCIGKTWQDLK